MRLTNETRPESEIRVEIERQNAAKRENFQRELDSFAEMYSSP